MIDSDVPICRKCGEEYTSMEEGFYWNSGRVCWKRPCKQCLARYNRREDQHKMRLKANRRYKKTDKGKEADKRAKKKWLRRKKNGEI